MFPKFSVAILIAPVPENTALAVNVILLDVSWVNVPPVTEKFPPTENVLPETSNVPADILEVLPNVTVPAVLVI